MMTEEEFNLYDRSLQRVISAGMILKLIEGVAFKGAPQLIEAGDWRGVVDKLRELARIGIAEIEK